MAERKICAVEGCEKPDRTRNLCSQHYYRWRKFGDPLAGGKLKQRQPDKCSVEWCEGKAVSNQLCRVHLSRVRRGASLDAPIRKPISSVCLADGCERSDRMRNGYCGMHAHRISRHGDPSATKRPENGARRAWVEAHANHVGDDCLVWPFSTGADGRGAVVVGSRTMVASRYMCVLANGPPPTPKHEAAHSCGKGHLGCLNPTHLGWKTRAENQADKIAHGTVYRGQGHWASKLTESDVKRIRARLASEGQADLAKEYGVCQSVISRIQSGKAWGWLS